MYAKKKAKTEPETGPLKKLRSSDKEIPCSKKGSEMGPQKGGMWPARLLYVVLLFSARF